MRSKLHQKQIVRLVSAVACVLFCLVAVYTGLLHGQSSANGKGPAPAAKTVPNPQGSGSKASSAGAADDDGPSPGNFLGSTFVPSINEPQPTAVAAAPPPPKPVPANAAGDPARQQVNNETASLLEMAYSLKADVDKTNKDELSISVVRKANQIEQLARKMRDEMRPALSKN